MNFGLAAWSPSIETVKTGCIWSASSAPLEVKRVISLEAQMRQLHKKIGFLVVPSLATNLILGTAFIGKYVEEIRSKLNIITPMNTSPVAIVNATYRNHVLTVESHNSQGQPDQLAAEQPCVVTRVTKLAPVSEKIMEVNNSARVNHLVSTHEHLIQKRQVLVTQGIVHTAPGVPFHIKVANLSSSYTTISKDMKVAQSMREGTINMVRTRVS